MKSSPIHYDCDPGQDDAIALLYALGSEKIDVRSISIVGGNANVWQCGKNAQQILDLVNHPNIPVFIGASRPLMRDLKTLPDVFGVTGMAGAEDLPPPSKKAEEIDWVNGLPSVMGGKVLVATGPLTNIAVEVQRNPNFPDFIDHLYIMGGCPYPEPLRHFMGNYKAEGSDDYAEYNFAVDPEAAKIVFRAGFQKITLIGLNVTRTVLYNQEVDQRLRAIRSVTANRTAKILSTVGEDDVVDYGHLRKTPTDPVRAVHDVVAMAAVDMPELFEFEYVPIRIVDGPLPVAAGRSLIDSDNYDHPSVRIATKIKVDEFWGQLLENIGRL